MASKDDVLQQVKETMSPRRFDRSARRRRAEMAATSRWLAELRANDRGVGVGPATSPGKAR